MKSLLPKAIFQRRLLHEESNNCLISINDALFKHRLDHTKKDDSRNFVFPKPIENFTINRSSNSKEDWGIIGPGNSEFLNILAGKYISSPPTGRSYPFRLSHFDYEQIIHLDFNASSNLEKVYLSARYESFGASESSGLSGNDNSVLNYITDQNNYNSNISKNKDESFISELLHCFHLEQHKDKWINALSNGQTRRAKLARVLAHKPTLLLIDNPFLGLDPDATKLVSESLNKVCKNISTSVVLGLRLQDEIPDWITHLAYVDDTGLCISGSKEAVIDKMSSTIDKEKKSTSEIHKRLNTKTQLIAKNFFPEGKDYHIEFRDASIAYKGKLLLEHFSWRIPKGSSWRIVGNNGTGKTTLLSFITGDHPQSWRNVIYIDGTLRKSGNGISVFELNNEIGMSSPELHCLVPGSKTMLEVVLNGLVKNIGNSNFGFKGNFEMLTPFGSKILSYFKNIIDEFGNTQFNDLSISNQKLALFLRAIVKNPKILILDEAFSCIDDVELMRKCHHIVENDLQNTTVLAIAHIDWELPVCDYILKLTGDGTNYYELWKYQNV